jgi:hypothetical protein
MNESLLSGGNESRGIGGTGTERERGLGGEWEQ